MKSEIPDDLENFGDNIKVRHPVHGDMPIIFVDTLFGYVHI